MRTASPRTLSCFTTRIIGSLLAVLVTTTGDGAIPKVAEAEGGLGRVPTSRRGGAVGQGEGVAFRRLASLRPKRGLCSQAQKKSSCAANITQINNVETARLPMTATKAWWAVGCFISSFYDSERMASESADERDRISDAVFGGGCDGVAGLAARLSRLSEGGADEQAVARMARVKPANGGIWRGRGLRPSQGWKNA